MVKAATPKQAERRPFSAADFRAWLPSSGHTIVAIKQEEHQWSALFLEFNIAGVGSSADEASEEARVLFWAYLKCRFMEGYSFADSHKPVPRRVRLRYRLSPYLSRVWRGVPSFAEFKEATFEMALLNHIPHPSA